MLNALVLAAALATKAAPAGPAPLRVAGDMNARGCCALRNATNGWDWSDDVTRRDCVKSARDVGLDVKSWFHYPNETCKAVQTRCGSPNPCP